MSVTISLQALHENRDTLIPQGSFSEPLTDTQALELIRFLKNALNLEYELHSDEWLGGHRSALLFAMTIIQRSNDLHHDNQH